MTVAGRRPPISELAFELPAGSHATVLLEERFPGGLDQGLPAHAPPGPRH